MTTSTEKSLVEQIPRSDLAHFDELDGYEATLEGNVLLPSDFLGAPAAVDGYPAPRATTITPTMLVSTLKEWGIAYKPYVPSGGTSASWLTHNRTAQQGWGPLCGVVVHNTAMTASQAAQLAYLWRGDGPTSSKPGPLCQFAVGKDGMIWLIGWGTATHSGPGDPDADRAARANVAPLTGEIVPNTSGTTPGTVRINPHFFGIEQMHAGEGPTAAQHAATVRLVAALLSLLGGPKNGYGAGSVLNHRELTTQRSDPQGVAKTGILRREIRDVLAKGPATAPAPTPPPVVKPPVVTPPPTSTKIATKVSLRTFPEVTSTHADVDVVADVTPIVPGTFRFEYRKPDGSWVAWKTVSAVTGKGSAGSTPGGNAAYQAIFTPTDSTKYATGKSAVVEHEVIDLVELRDRIAALEARLPKEA